MYSYSGYGQSERTQVIQGVKVCCQAFFFASVKNEQHQAGSSVRGRRSDGKGKESPRENEEGARGSSSSSRRFPLFPSRLNACHVG